MASKFLLICLLVTQTSLSFAQKNPAVEKTVSGFLEWYATNLDRLQKFNFLINYNEGKKSDKAYDVEYKATEKYFTELKKTGFIGAKFIEKKRNFFLALEKKLKTQPVYEGLPDELKTDLILLSLNPKELLVQLDKITFLSSIVQSNNYALATVKFVNGTVLKFELSKQNNQWLIQDISK